MSTIKVDTIATRTGSGSITVSNDASLSGTLAVTGNATASTIALGGRSFNAGNTPLGVNFSSAAGTGLQINDTNSGNLGGMLQFYSGSGGGTLRANIQNANNAGVHFCVGTSGSVVFTQNGYVDANALDDYEEGTWTPNWSTPGGSLTYSSQSGVYTKVGRVVHWKYQLNISGGAAGSGNVQIGGLPFTPTANLQLGRFPLQTSSVNFDGNAFTMYHYVSGGTLHVLYSYDNGGWATATTSNFTVTNGSILTSKGSYFV